MVACSSYEEYLDFFHKSDSSKDESYPYPLDRSSFADTLCQWGRLYKDAPSIPRIPRYHRDPPNPRTSTPSATLGAPPDDTPDGPEEDYRQAPPEDSTDPWLTSPPRSQDQEETREEEMSAEEDASMVSRTPPRSYISEPEDAGDFPSDFPSADPCSGNCPLSIALSSWQDIVLAIKLKFEEDILPPSPRKRTCRVRDDSGFHQEEEDPVFRLPLFPTLQEFFGFLQKDLRNPPPQTRGFRLCPRSPGLLSPGRALRSGGKGRPAPPRE